jgi:cell fate (sporulation/competence/biofilm development) regulator YmcA (YheA/YmcA/DUF963 family)
MQIWDSMKKIDKSRIKCYWYDRYGHYQSEYYTNLVKGKIEKEKIIDQYKENQDEAKLLMVY